MSKLIEDLKRELQLKRRELAIEHRIFMAIKETKEESYEYVETVIELLEKNKEESK